jgi:hypothetical protein
MGVNLGASAVQAAIEFWSPENRAKRKARRSARKKARKGEQLTKDEEILMAQETVKVILPDNTEVERVEPVIKARTSTKVAAVGVSTIVTTGIAMLPFYDQINAVVLEACNSSSKAGPAAILIGMGVMLVINAVTARVTKSPVVPGKL